MPMTGPDYDRLITSRLTGRPINRDQIWVLLFVNSPSASANQPGEGIDDKRAMQNYKKLAKKYKGAIRFAWVDARQEELLAASFDARFYPQTFVIRDGVAYWYRDFATE